MVIRNTKDKHNSTATKKSYCSPALTHFGTIRELTSGGSSGDNEGMKNKDMKKRS